MALPRTVRLGLSRHHARAHVDQWADLLPKALAAGLGSPATFALSEDYEELLGAVTASAVDVAWLPPLLHARAAEQGARLVALPQRGGWLTFRSALLVRQGDPVESAAKLRNARAAWRDKSSASGHLFPRIELAALGATLGAEAFFGSIEEAAQAVVDQKADLCTCFVSDAARDPQRAAAEVAQALGPLAEKLRVLHVTDPIPPDGFVVAPALTAPEAAAITAALLALHTTPEGRTALKEVLQAEKLAPVNDALLRSLKSWAQAAAARAG
jgi:phosphonate transport system substrate-binding protein